MNGPRQNPFFLPIHLTGLAEWDVVVRGWAIAALALLAAAAVTVAAHALGPPPLSAWELLADAAFLLVRVPPTVKSAWPEAQASGWGLPLLLAGLLCFVTLANGSFAKAGEAIALRLSIHDPFPFQRNDSERKRAARTPVLLLVLILLGGALLWIHLARETDTLPLRLVRLISIGLFVQLGTLLAGGAMACALAEGRGGREALGRMIRLAWRGKGDLVRAVICTLPRWYMLSLLNWCTAFAGFVLPFLLTGALMGAYLSFLKAQGSWLVRAVLLGVGLWMVVTWGTVWRRHDSLARFAALGGLLGSVWCLVVLPLVPGAYRDQLHPWFGAGLEFVLGQSTALPPGGVGVGVFLVGTAILLVGTALLGVWLFLFPLAAGTCAFFMLRCAVEQKDYRHSGASRPVTKRTSADISGAMIFSPQGESMLDNLEPPRGWLPLAYLTLRPIPLLISSSAVTIVVTLLQLGAAGPWPAVAVAAVLVTCFPFLCRPIARILAGKPRGDELRSGLMPVRMVGAWLHILLAMTLMTVAIGIGGSLGLIPWAGPPLWGVFYLAMVLGACWLAHQVILWVPGSLMLAPMVAFDVEPSAGAGDVLRQAGRVGARATWTFLGAVAVGLVFALLPALVCAAVVDLMDRWSPTTLILASGLALLGFATAVTNAYLTIRKSAVAGDKSDNSGEAEDVPLHIGDRVILCRHRPINGEDNWSPEMNQYVGREARVTTLDGKDQSGCDGARVDADGGRFFWRVRDLKRL
ncbi:MAG: hypothetical protein AAB654_17085 [Acidobacteriota bacterium]